MVQSKGKIIRAICILDHPLKDVKIKVKDGEPSAQIILPQRQIGRKNGINKNYNI